MERRRGRAEADARAEPARRAQIEGVRKLEAEVSDALELIELAEAEGDAAMAAEGLAALRTLAEEAKRREIESLLSGEADANDAMSRSTPAPAAPRRRTGPRC